MNKKVIGAIGGLVVIALAGLAYWGYKVYIEDPDYDDDFDEDYEDEEAAEA